MGLDATYLRCHVDPMLRHWVLIEYRQGRSAGSWKLWGQCANARDPDQLPSFSGKRFEEASKCMGFPPSTVNDDAKIVVVA